MPSGREIHSTKPFVPPSLEDETLARMRAPPEFDGHSEGDDDSSDEEAADNRTHLPCTFPESSGAALSGDPYY